MNIWKWTAVVLVMVGSSFPRNAKAERQLREKSHVDVFVDASSPSGKIRVNVREVQTEIMGAKGPIPLSVLVLRDPGSGTFTWRAHTADSRNPSLRSQQLNADQAVFLKDRKFTDFIALPIPLRLFVHSYSGHSTDIDDAEVQALRAASVSLDPLGDLENVPGMHVISLLSVGRDFTSGPPDYLETFPKVTSAQWDGKRWTVILKARWKEEIVLDSDFKVISMRKEAN